MRWFPKPIIYAALITTLLALTAFSLLPTWIR
jgi:hypothetical protein